MFDAYRSATSQNGANDWNAALLIGWDEPGGTYDHVPPGPVPPPHPSAPPGECDFTFDRSGYRVPAIIVSPWVESGSVHNDEYRHTSLIATLRKAWGLGDPFTHRDASARTIENVFSLDTPHDPTTWATIAARPVPEWTMDLEVVGKGLSTLGKGMGPPSSTGPDRWAHSSPPKSTIPVQRSPRTSSSHSYEPSPNTSSPSSREPRTTPTDRAPGSPGRSKPNPRGTIRALTAVLH